MDLTLKIGIVFDLSNIYLNCVASIDGDLVKLATPIQQNKINLTSGRA